jgi:phage terminase large subunit
LRVEWDVAPVFEPLLEPARYKGAHGGRGSGKSWFFAGEALDALLRGLNVLCVREVQNSIADSVKKLIEARIESLGLDPLFEITDKEIRCPASGGYAIFRGMQNHTAASVKSLENFDVAFWEEAQTATQYSLDLLAPTIRNPNSELWFAWNPENEDDPIEFLRKEEIESAIVVEANWSDNPWFPDVLREDMERDYRRDRDKAAHVWGGEYRSASEARVFKNWKVKELTPPENVIWFYGVDWGFANDETAGLRCCFVDSETIYVDHEVYELGVATEALPGFLNGLPDATKWPMRADSARPESIDHVRRHGFPKLRKARKGAGSIEDGISFLQGFDIMVHPRCANLVRELKHYAYKTDPRTNEILPVVEDKNNHLVDALRYAVEGLHKRGRLIKEMIEPKSERLERPRDYQSHHRETSSWKTA